MRHVAIICWYGGWLNKDAATDGARQSAGDGLPVTNRRI